MVLSKVIFVCLLLTAATIGNCSAADSICQYLEEDLEGGDGFCSSKDLLGKELEKDLELNGLKNLKKCCGASDNFKYECVS